MISGGRCHGPGCQQAAVVDYWCGEACQARWHRSAEAAPSRPAEWYVPDGAPLAHVELAPFLEAMNRTVRQLAEVTEMPVNLVIDWGDPAVPTSTGRSAAHPPTWPVPPFSNAAVAHAAEVERLTLHLRMACPPDRFDAALAEVEDLMATTWMPRVEALQRVLAEGRFVSADVPSELVASKDPQVGFFRRWLDRLPGRRT